jgi:hypothetical protein
MADQHLLSPRVIRDFSLGYDGPDAPTRGIRETNHAHALNLIIKPQGEHFHLTVVPAADPAIENVFGANLEATLPLTKAELSGHVAACQDTWRRVAVDRLDGGTRVFQEYWDLKASPRHLRAVERELAEAGAKLFLAIFRAQGDGPSPDLDRLHAIAAGLRQYMASNTAWVKVTSSRFFAPWNLLYSSALPADETAPIDRRGFWGYQHVVEHVPDDSGSLAFALEENTPLKLGVQIDAMLDKDLNVSCLKPVLDHFATYQDARLQPVIRDRKHVLKSALAATADDQVLYFCCHGQQEGPVAPIGALGGIRLTDPPNAVQSWITPEDIGLWMDLKNFDHRPLVFLNACGGGQINSIFYEGFARTFLGRHASSVIGPQTDVPARLAGQFAQRFFERFFAGGLPNKVGLILFDLRREFFDTYNNPLGLLYSLYRGGDTHLRSDLNAGN